MNSLSVISNEVPSCISNSKELLEAWNNTNAVIEKTDHLSKIWCRSRTPWSLENISLTLMGMSPWNRIRQVSAEMDSRRAAMMEAKWGLLRLDAEIAIAERALGKENDELQATLLRVEIGEKKERIEMIFNKFNGAMRDVRDLGIIYDKLSSELGLVTEDSVNLAERRSHIERAIRQSIRDVRQSGRILNGNQEYLEQCGVNPSAALSVIQRFVNSERAANAMGTAELDSFISQFTDEIIQETE